MAEKDKPGKAKKDAKKELAEKLKERSKQISEELGKKIAVEEVSGIPVKKLEEIEKEFEGSITELRPKYIQAISEWKGSLLYPDANGTKRLSYGRVKGYSPRDAVNYKFYTTAKGIVEKYTGKDPFDSPQAVLDLIRQQAFNEYIDATSRTMNINFLTTLDTTGGNSGSPILNAKGKLIGLLFDGNYESIVADFKFDEDSARSIVVDIRYVLWLMKYIDSAHHLLKEMGIS